MLLLFAEYIPLPVGIMLLLGTFGIQLLFCFLAEKKSIKLFPLYLLLAAGCSQVFGLDLFAVEVTGQINALIWLIILSFCAVGVLWGWLIYKIVCIQKKN